jgi:hypothetical protein
MNSSPPLSERSLEPITVVQQPPEPEESEESEDLDPLFWAWGPPANETPAQRAVREAEEKDARLVSERIDEEIREERHQKLGKRPVKVILVGQEGSGASPLTPADHFFSLLTSSVGACRRVCIFTRSVRDSTFASVLKYIY